MSSFVAAENDVDVGLSDSISQVSAASSGRRLELNRQRAKLKAQLAIRKEQEELELD